MSAFPLVKHFGTMALKVSAAGVLLSALSACTAVGNGWSEYGYGYYDVRLDPTAGPAGYAFPAPNPNGTGLSRQGIAHPASSSQYAYINTGRSIFPSIVPSIVPRQVVPRLPRTTTLLPSRPIVPPMITSRIAQPNRVAEHAVCHSISNPKADPIGLPLSSIGYHSGGFMNLPTPAQYIDYVYSHRTVNADDRAFVSLASSLGQTGLPSSYGRSVVPSLVYGGNANRMVRLGNAQFLVDLAAVPGARGGLYLCNLNGNLHIDRVNQNCCGQPLLIGREPLAWRMK